MRRKRDSIIYIEYLLLKYSGAKLRSKVGINSLLKNEQSKLLRIKMRTAAKRKFYSSPVSYYPRKVSSLANLATMPLRARTASRLGMTIRPLNISDISQTRPTFWKEPTTMNTKAMTP